MTKKVDRAMQSTNRPLPAGNESAALARFRRPALLVALVGLGLAILGAFLDREQFWRSYLLAFLFWLEIGLGCLGLLMLHHLVGGRWSALIRRLMETGAMTLPLMAILFLPLLLGLTTLYPWTDAAHVQASPLLQQKTAYLNLPFFLGRAALYFAVWLVLAYLLNRWSLAQDRTGEEQWTRRMRRLSALGIILHMLTATFAAYDWMMSLEPEWYSSIYGLLFIIGQALAGLAVAIIGLRLLAKHYAAEGDWTQSFNDLGNFLLGFVMIWAYFSFSQFLIIWSANIPEEAIWYVHRSQGGWLNVGLFLIVFHFALPFFLLLARRVKRQAQLLTALAVLIFCSRWVDLFWLITPAFYPEGVRLHWLDFVILLAMGAGWLAVFLWQWVGKAPLPQHDPHLEAIANPVVAPESAGA
jgi:hypothetical protein